MKLHSVDKTPAQGDVFIFCENASIKWRFYPPDQNAPLRWRSIKKLGVLILFLLSSMLNDINDYEMYFHDEMT